MFQVYCQLNTHWFWDKFFFSNPKSIFLKEELKKSFGGIKAFIMLVLSSATYSEWEDMVFYYFFWKMVILF